MHKKRVYLAAKLSADTYSLAHIISQKIPIISQRTRNQVFVSYCANLYICIGT